MTQSVIWAATSFIRVRVFLKHETVRRLLAFKLNDKGKTAGGEFRVSKRYRPFFLWLNELKI
jgi:hypothetical protein